jgi:DNA-binding beta-propeller fold protein YncE
VFTNQPDAQLVGTFMDYQESITTDEEDKKLYLSSFVFAEPFMNEVYVIDGRARVIIYTRDLFPIYTLSRGDGIEAPQGLTVDSDGNLYVAQSKSKSIPRARISVYNACLKWERDIFIEGFEGADSFRPYRLAVDKRGNLYVSAAYWPGVLVLDRNGLLIDIMAPEDNGKKARLNNVTIDKNGKIYLVSEETGHIYVFDEDRKLILQFGDKGGSTGKLSRPKAIGVDNKDGKMYVADYMRHTINVYNKEGKFIFEFGGRGLSPGWFAYPTGISVDNSGRVFIADYFNSRVQIFIPRLQTKKKDLNELAESTGHDDFFMDIFDNGTEVITPRLRARKTGATYPLTSTAHDDFSANIPGYRTITLRKQDTVKQGHLELLPPQQKTLN